MICPSCKLNVTCNKHGEGDHLSRYKLQVDGWWWIGCGNCSDEAYNRDDDPREGIIHFCASWMKDTAGTKQITLINK